MKRISIEELVKLPTGIIVANGKRGVAATEVVCITHANDELHIILGATVRACPTTGGWRRIPTRERIIIGESRIQPMVFLGAINVLRKDGRNAVCMRTDRTIPIVLRAPIGGREHMPLPDFSLFS